MTEIEAIKELKEYAENSWGDLNESFELSIKALEEVQQYRALGTPTQILEKIGGLNIELGKYACIGTVEELKHLKEMNEDCTIKHLTGECSYNETGCSDCIGREKIRKALEKQIPKKVVNIQGNPIWG